MELRHPAPHPLIGSSAHRRGAHAHPRGRRALAWIFSWRLDEALADRADPERDPLIACRAAQLVEPAARHELAEGFRAAVEAAVLTRPWGAAVPVAADAVRANSGLLLALASRLDSQAPIGACGVARAQLLLTNGASPLYRPAPPLRLQDAVEAALIGLGI